MKPVCLILGAGSGIGGNTARVFAKNGYHVHLCRRSDSKGLDELIKSFKFIIEQGFNAEKDNIDTNITIRIEKKNEVRL